MPDLLDVCPNGAWVTEEQAVQMLGMSSRSDLRDAFTSGSLPHVFVEHGKRHDNLPEPYNKHRFFFIQKEGTTCSGPCVGLATWANMCQSIENGERDEERLKEYTGNANVEDAYRDLQGTHGIVTSSELARSPSADADGRYRYGTNGGKMLAPSKASSFKNSPQQAEGEIYTRADGKKVRRVKKSSSASGASLNEGGGSPKKTLSGFLSGGDRDKGQSKLGKLSGSRSLAGGEGEIYVRADGKKGEFPSACILFEKKVD